MDEYKIILGRVSTSVREAALSLFHGDEKAAAHWLSTPCKALGNISPIDSIALTGDNQDVLAVIGRLEHGVFQ